MAELTLEIARKILDVAPTDFSAYFEGRNPA